MLAVAVLDGSCTMIPARGFTFACDVLPESDYISRMRIAFSAQTHFHDGMVFT